MADEPVIETPQAEVPAPEAVSSEASIPTSTSPDTSSGSGSVSDASTSSPDTSVSSPVSFDYSSWDGQSDSLPEAYRPIYDHISGGLRSEMEGLQNSLQQDKELYEALLQSEGVDTNLREKLQQTEKELAEERESYKGWTTEKAELTKTRDDLQGKLDSAEKAEQAQVQAWVDQFKTKHKEMLADDGKREQFLQYIESGMEPEFAVTLMDKDPQFTRRVQAYRLQNVPDQYAVQLATADLGTEAAKPRASAEMAAGAGEAANNPSSAEKDVLSGTHNIRDIRRLAAERALKKHSG